MKIIRFTESNTSFLNSFSFPMPKKALFDQFEREKRSAALEKFDEKDILDMNIQSGGFRDGLTQAFTLVLFTEIADKTFFVACIMGSLIYVFSVCKS